MGRANRLIKAAISRCDKVSWAPSPSNDHLQFLNNLYFLSVLTESPADIIGHEEDVIRYLNAVETGGMESSDIPRLSAWHPQLGLYMEGLLNFKQMDFVGAMNRFSECRKSTGDREATFLDDMCLLMMTRCSYWYSYFLAKAPAAYQTKWPELQAAPKPAPEWITNPSAFVENVCSMPGNHFSDECRTYLSYLKEERQ
jgi:hypothetical protein